jgi:uncharacterized protein YecE (DUF72 family)
MAKKASSGEIRVGIGGWTFEPWRGGTFFPEKHPKARELEYASRKVTTIEINGTYYSTQKPTTFRKWHGETPDDFVFAVKANRFTTNRKVLAEAKPSIDMFLKSGLSELKHKLGPILWQFAPTKKFDAADFEGFLDLLPKTLDGLKLRHALEVRHESFAAPEFVALARKHGAAIVYAHHETYPEIADITADFVYARLQQTAAKVETGYTSAELKKWAARAKEWSHGKQPKDLPVVGTPPKPAATDVYLYFIAGAKERNPAAAQALAKELKS